MLFVNSGFTTHVKGLARWESRGLLDLLFNHIATTPALTCRVRWEPNTLTFWDNRCTQHHAIWDYFPQSRYGERVSIVGTRPDRVISLDVCASFAIIRPRRGCSSMAERQLPKLHTRVRFPSPAPLHTTSLLNRKICMRPERYRWLLACNLFAILTVSSGLGVLQPVRLHARCSRRSADFRWRRFRRGGTVLSDRRRGWTGHRAHAADVAMRASS